MTTVPCSIVAAYNKTIVPWSILFSCTLVLKLLGMFYVNAVVTPIVSCICLLVLLSKTNFRIRIYKPMLWFFIYISIALLMARPNPIFHSWSRLVLFGIVVLLASPLIQTTPFLIFRRQCLYIITLLFISISTISFVCYFLGINYMVDDAGVVYNYFEHPGGFGGITHQSMSLGIIVACSVCGLIRLGLSRKWWWILVPICFATSLFAASRGVVIIMIAGAVVMIFIQTGAHWRKFIKYLWLLTLLASISFPLWREATGALVAKGQGERKDMGFFESRTAKITARYEEFLSSPLIGIGFSVIDADGRDGFEETEGTIEPGSSWMAVLSMTGIIGLCFMLYIVQDSFLTVWRMPFYDKDKAFLVGLLVLWCMGMLYEGYVFAAGNTFCVCVWLTIGVCKDSYAYSSQCDSP